MDEVKKSVGFSDYIYILFRWKNFLVINLLLIVLVTTGITFLIPKTYKSTTVVMIPPESPLGLSGLSGLVGGKSSPVSLGAKLFGSANSSEDVLLGILNSRTMLTMVINKFELLKYYEIDDNNLDKGLKAFVGDLSFDLNEYSMIEVSVINKNPVECAKIANYFIYLLDSLNIKLNIEQALNNRKFIEQRYLKNLLDLKFAEDSLHILQKKYGIFAVPEQLSVAVKAAAEIEAQLMAKEVSTYFIKQQYGENSPQYQGALAEVNMLKAKVMELKNSDNVSKESNVFFPFNKVSDITLNYFRYLRQVEIQSKILELVLPMYEQAKVEEQKKIPTIAVLDKAQIPQLKNGPKKLFIILFVMFFAFFVHIVLVLRGNGVMKAQAFGNPLLIAEHRFFAKLSSLYKVKQ
ncbi:MAG: hypothetical protein Q8N83_10510 [Ignavibacteria bacterium]|nr:hypothetical protein [Ignavibacteria bacterium]